MITNFRSQKRIFSRGFTLLETLISIVIVILLISIVFYSFSSFKNDSTLQENVSQAKSLLENARYLSISEKNNYSYGIHLQSDRLVSFIGPIYSSSDNRNNTLLLSGAILDNISLNGGGSEILFSTTTGSTNNLGSFRIKSSSNFNSSTTISVTGTGVISQQ